MLDVVLKHYDLVWKVAVDHVTCDPVAATSVPLCYFYYKI